MTSTAEEHSNSSGQSSDRHEQFLDKIKSPQKGNNHLLKNDFKILNEQALLSSDKFSLYQKVMRVIDDATQADHTVLKKNVLDATSELLNYTTGRDRPYQVNPEIAANCIKLLATYGDTRQQLNALEKYIDIHEGIVSKSTQEEVSRALLVASELYLQESIKVVERDWLRTIRTIDNPVDCYDFISEVLLHPNTHRDVYFSVLDILQTRIFSKRENSDTLLQNNEFIDAKTATLNAILESPHAQQDKSNFWEDYAYQFHINQFLPIQEETDDQTQDARLYRFQYDANRFLENAYGYILPQESAVDYSPLYPVLLESVTEIINGDSCMDSAWQQSDDYFCRFIQRITPNESDDHAVITIINTVMGENFILNKELFNCGIRITPSIEERQERLNQLYEQILTHADENTFCYIAVSEQLRG